MSLILNIDLNNETPLVEEQNKLIYVYSLCLIKAPLWGLPNL